MNGSRNILIDAFVGHMGRVLVSVQGEPSKRQKLVPPEAAEAMQVGLSDRLQMRIFGTIEQVQAWLRAAHQADRLILPSQPK